MLRLLVSAAVLLAATEATAQKKYAAKNGYVSFFSEAPIENIRAENNTANSIFVGNTGVVAFSVLNKDFQFQKKLMQEHFNDKYMESHKFPTSTFSGMITGYSLDAGGLQSVRAKGKLTIHGITKMIDVPGTFEVTAEGIQMRSEFTVRLADHGITIPAILWQNISEEVEVTINLSYNTNN